MEARLIRRSCSSSLGSAPANVLKARGIEVTHELNGVGENLQDHFGIGVQCRSRSGTTVNDLHNIASRAASNSSAISYSGPALSPTTGTIRTPSSIARLTSPTPDMMVTFMAWCTREDLTPYPFSGFTILAEHMRPDSRGYVRREERRPDDPPEILFNFFDSEPDRRAAIAGLKFAPKDFADRSDVRLASKARSRPALMSDRRRDDGLLPEGGLSLLHRLAPARWASAPTRSSIRGYA